MNFSDIKKQNYCLSSSFPKVEKNKKNDKVVKKLLDIYAGSKSELTAVSQYLYESFYTRPNEKDQELSEILEKISICEMRHVEVISQILLSMGVNPKFCKYIDNNFNLCNYWSAGNVKYLTDPKKFIAYNIKLEEFAIEEYKELLALTDSDNIKSIVNVILDDEKAHLEVFRQIQTILETNTSLSRGISEETEKVEIIEKTEIEVENRACEEKEQDKDQQELETRSIPEVTEKKEEIVSIFGTSTPSKVEIVEEPEEKMPISDEVRTQNDSLEMIQIPLSDITDSTAEEIEYQNRLEEKNYDPDEIVDG